MHYAISVSMPIKLGHQLQYALHDLQSHKRLRCLLKTVIRFLPLGFRVRSSVYSFGGKPHRMLKVFQRFGKHYNVVKPSRLTSISRSYNIFMCLPALTLRLLWRYFVTSVPSAVL